jgi:RNA polymerase sigma factor (sigma-70 family)
MPPTNGGAAFAATRWTIVLAAADKSEETRSRLALEELAQGYWFPLYAFVRRQGYSPHDAQDLTQDFFARLIEKGSLAAADKSRGRFRTFLLAALKHFLANDWDRTTAKKRGGGHAPIALDALDAETRYKFEPVDAMTPERVFDRRWALAVLDQVMSRLQSDYTYKGQSALYNALRPMLTADRQAQPYAELGRQLGMTEGAVKIAAHRLRRHYREIMRDEIAQTVAGPEEIEAELHHLRNSL